MSYNIKSRNFISTKNKRELIQELINLYGDKVNFIDKKDPIEKIKTEEEQNFYIKKGKIWLFNKDNVLIPSLHCLKEHPENVFRVTVDVGAIRFVTNGADVMAPGVSFFDNRIKEGMIVAVDEEKANTLLAVGRALINAEEFKDKEKGKVVEVIHHLTDEWWEWTL